MAAIKLHLSLAGITALALASVPAAVTFRKGVIPGLLFRRPAPKVAALVH